MATQLLKLAGQPDQIIDETHANYQPLLQQGYKVDSSYKPAMADSQTANNLSGTGIKLNIPSTIPSTSLKTSFSVGDVQARRRQLEGIQTEKMESERAIRDYQQKVLSTLDLSNEEIGLGRDYNRSLQRIRNLDESTVAGLDKIEDKVMPLEFITGQQASLERRASRTRQGLVNTATTFSEALKMAEGRRKNVFDKASTALGFAKDDLIRLTGLEKDLRDLDKDDRATANQVLEFAIDNYANIPGEELLQDGEAMQSLKELSEVSGMPLLLILNGVANARTKLEQTAAKAQRDAAPDYEYFTDALGNVRAFDPATGEVKDLGAVEPPQKKAGGSSGGGGNKVKVDTPSGTTYYFSQKEMTEAEAYLKRVLENGQDPYKIPAKYQQFVLDHLEEDTEEDSGGGFLQSVANRTTRPGSIAERIFGKNLFKKG